MGGASTSEGGSCGWILIEQEGENLFESEEEVRLLCKRLRFDPELDERLMRRIEDTHTIFAQR